MKPADKSLELAKVLAGQGAISDQDFLERMARSDDLGVVSVQRRFGGYGGVSVD